MNRIKRPLLISLTLTLASAALLAAPSSRPDGARGAEGRFTTIDRNQDGALDRNEVAAAEPRWAEQFDRMDRNRDQRIEQREFREARRLAEARRALSQAKRDLHRAQFAFLDVDGDRALTQVELGDHAPRLAEKFVQVDANHDGRLVADELRAFRQAQREARGSSVPRG